MYHKELQRLSGSEFHNINHNGYASDHVTTGWRARSGEQKTSSSQYCGVRKSLRYGHRTSSIWCGRQLHIMAKHLPHCSGTTIRHFHRSLSFHASISIYESTSSNTPLQGVHEDLSAHVMVSV